MFWGNLLSGLLCPSASCLQKQIAYCHDMEITATRWWDLLKDLLECCKVSSGTFFIILMDLVPKQKQTNKRKNMITIWRWLGSMLSVEPSQKEKAAAANVQLCSEKNIKTNNFTENYSVKSCATIGSTLLELRIVCLGPVVQNGQKEKALRG